MVSGALGDAWSGEGTTRHAKAVSAARDLECDLLSGEERVYMESAFSRLSSLACGMATIPKVAGQRNAGSGALGVAKTGPRQRGSPGAPERRHLGQLIGPGGGKKGRCWGYDGGKKIMDASDTSSSTPSN